MRIAVSRVPGAQRVVTPLELFFDLVYVFAIAQLSHHLLEHVDLRTGAETVILTLAVVYAWYMTAWGANWLEPDRRPVQLMLIGLMFASLLMSVAIPDAFGDRAWLFVTGYLVLRVGRCGFLIVALRGRPQGEHFVNDLVWEVLLSAPLRLPARSPAKVSRSPSRAGQATRERHPVGRVSAQVGVMPTAPTRQRGHRIEAPAGQGAGRRSAASRRARRRGGSARRSS